ncbi:MAG: ATP-binding protein [Cyanobacteria bacterium P01_D01_bin.50]
MPINWKQINNESSATPKDDKTNQETPEIEKVETFVPQVPTRSLDDLIVSTSVRSRIETAVNRIRYHDKLYNTWNLKKIDPKGSHVAINLFGAPGTGKTFCAEAIAHHFHKKIITVNYAEIESKYVGETPKNITAAFRKAQETDSVLFFDEADSILGKRLTNVTQSADHGVNVSRAVMLLQLDSFEGIVIFASNLPENYDGAFVRRILAHIEFELPDLDCRLKLWKYLLPEEIPLSPDVTPQWLASESEGLAGGDILNVVKLSASQAVARNGNKCRVFQTDILEAIAQVRNSKEKIAVNPIHQPTVIKETVIQPDELPDDVRQRYDSEVSNPSEALPNDNE